jgi:protein-tyrosine phosphatase
MAEAIFKRMVQEKELGYYFEISSYATSDCEEGNSVYYPAARVLKEKGYDFSHKAKQVSLREIINADYILVMDDINLHDLTRLTCGHYGEKIFKLGHFLPEKIDIDDPWYTRDFERTYKEIYSSCQNFLTYLINERNLG